jgi:hypothetical protein
MAGDKEGTLAVKHESTKKAFGVFSLEEEPSYRGVHSYITVLLCFFFNFL